MFPQSPRSRSFPRTLLVLYAVCVAVFQVRAILKLPGKATSSVLLTFQGAVALPAGEFAVGALALLVFHLLARARGESAEARLAGWVALAWHVGALAGLLKSVPWYDDEPMPDSGSAVLALPGLFACAYTVFKVPRRDTKSASLPLWGRPVRVLVAVAGLAGLVVEAYIGVLAYTSSSLADLLPKVAFEQYDLRLLDPNVVRSAEVFETMQTLLWISLATGTVGSSVALLSKSHQMALAGLRVMAMTPVLFAISNAVTLMLSSSQLYRQVHMAHIKLLALTNWPFLLIFLVAWATSKRPLWKQTRQPAPSKHE